MDGQLTVMQSKSYEMRGQNVMLDFDLAKMYGIETRQLRRVVRRNIERFEDEDLTKEELSRCQIGILNKGRGSNIKYMLLSLQNWEWRCLVAYLILKQQLK